MDVGALITRFRAVPPGTTALRAERRVVSKSLTGNTRGEVLALAHGLIRAKLPRFVAYELVLSHPPTMDALTVEEVEGLGAGLTHWGDVDAFACIVAGPAWRAGRIRRPAIERWARSADWCWRRAALVSTVPLNSRARGGRGDTPRTLGVCARLAGDHHDMVEKALSWALRELSKRDPASVEEFLRKFDSKLGARVIREVNNKLTMGLKNPGKGR
jgi:3-methyladenine DNA glycosylase AlkD